MVVNGARANYTVAKEVWGYGLTDLAGSGGHDALLNVERVQFNDGWMALDVNGNAGEAFRLYQAAFGRPAEDAGLGYWIWRMDNGSSLTQVAHEFMTGQPEFDKLYGSNPSDNDFINHLCENVLHREADAAGFAYWLNVLHTSPNARGMMRFSLQGHAVSDEDRIINIEIKLTDQENLVDTLNRTVYEQSRRIDQLEALVAKMAEHIRVLRDREQGPVNERPPHY